MKKLILLFCSVLIFIACRNENDNKNNANYTTDTLSYTYDSVKVYSKNYVKNESNLGDTTKAIITYPVFKNINLNSFIERKVANYFGEDEQLISYKYVANSFVKGYDEFFHENKETFQDWFLIINISVLNQQKDYISLKYTHSDYSGGAHPNTNITFINYNPQTGHAITLDTLIKADKKLELTTIGENIFRKNENISLNASLADNYFFENGKFFLPENFYISKKGLVFLYNPYEIKPYAAGITELVIPFSYLKDLIKQNTTLSHSINASI